jgi:hypothetical protein
VVQLCQIVVRRVLDSELGGTLIIRACSVRLGQFQCPLITP